MSIVFEHKTIVENSIEDAFAWHERKGAFRRLMPPWELAEEVRADGRKSFNTILDRVQEAKGMTHSNSVAVVPGSARNIGRATAIKLGELGFGVVVHTNNDDENLQQTADLVRQTGVECATAIGSLDNPQKLIPTMVKKICSNQIMEMSDCNQKRDFIYIGDLIEGYNLLLKDFDRKLFDIFNLFISPQNVLK